MSQQQPPEAEMKEDPNAQPEGQISIFEAPSMRLLDRKSLRAEGTSLHQWLRIELPPSSGCLSAYMFHLCPHSLTWFSFPSHKQACAASTGRPRAT